MTITKKDIVEQVAKAGFTKKKSAEMVEKLLDIIKTTLENREDVLISGFGKFSGKDKRKWRRNNPYKGDNRVLDERKVVTFRCSSILRHKINAK